LHDADAGDLDDATSRVPETTKISVRAIALRWITMSPVW
jgi:hypothetical protein